MNRQPSEQSLPAETPPEPVRFSAMLQSWCSLTFLHWRYPVEIVRPHIPPPLELESFDGSAWIGVAPFMIRGLRPAFLPSLPWISEFPETNCRTYVKGPDGRSGVWFFSLDAARAAAVAGARLTYGLPYAWSRMRVTRTATRVTYESRRRWPDATARSRIVVEPGDPIPSGPLERFLTARFRLYSFMLGRLTYTAVEHAPWPLQAARLVEADQSIIECAGLPTPAGLPTVHFSQGVRVRVAAPKPVRATTPGPFDPQW